MAVVLAGGVGSRLRPYTMNIPKPLLPLGDVPIIEVALRQLSNAGFDRVVITVGHLSHLLMASLGDGSDYGLKIEYVKESEPLGTAGPLRGVDALEDDFLVMNGDVLTTLDFAKLLDVHRVSGAGATIAVHRRTVDIDYGVLNLDSANFLKSYTEKPSLDYFVSMGIYVIKRSTVALIPSGERFDIPSLMTKLRDNGSQVFCHVVDDYWQDIGRIDDYAHASEDFTANPERFLARQA